AVRLVLLLAASAAGPGCLTGPPGQIIVPSDIMRGAPYGPEGQPPRSRYVVRMSDGEQDWELQLPEIATAYEVRIPLKGRPGGPGRGGRGVGAPRGQGARAPAGGGRAGRRRQPAPRRRVRRERQPEAAPGGAPGRAGALAAHELPPDAGQGEGALQD